MVGVDDSPAGSAAAEWAATLAAHFHVLLNLVRVVPTSGFFQHASRYLEAVNHGRSCWPRRLVGYRTRIRRSQSPRP
ncbi:universal stress protein [Pseudarthrobacter sp. MDT1-22]